jgi:hypothetical protein
VGVTACTSEVVDDCGYFLAFVARKVSLKATTARQRQRGGSGIRTRGSVTYFRLASERLKPLDHPTLQGLS